MIQTNIYAFLHNLEISCIIIMKLLRFNKSQCVWYQFVKVDEHARFAAIATLILQYPVSVSI